MIIKFISTTVIYIFTLHIAHARALGVGFMDSHGIVPLPLSTLKHDEDTKVVVVNTNVLFLVFGSRSQFSSNWV